VDADEKKPICPGGAEGQRENASWERLETVSHDFQPFRHVTVEFNIYHLGGGEKSAKFGDPEADDLTLTSHFSYRKITHLQYTFSPLAH